jgi:hypothetical protein
LDVPPRAKKVSKKQRDSGKRYLVSLRLGLDTRQKLEEAATKSGRSLAAEAETRLELTFRQDEQSEINALKLQFGPFLGVLLAAGVVAEKFSALHHILRVQEQWKREGDVRLGDVMNSQGGPFGWLNDPVAYKKALVAANEVFESFKPVKETAEDEDPFPKIDPKQARDLLRYLILRPEYTLIRSALGDLINRLPPPTDATESHSHQDPE